ncbi:PREDICTED: protein TIFY 4B isoform X2 [Theobroma cacao]|uniref:Protein TIFY n=2 Tax=Theobroma cacao TaxID=3641 RepID=A0AB32VQW0_THECC|nr:PREDICTED: protein TIFY 4B isoform X2 [Theobroma cacao]EOX94663.1 TIFY domain/Divergent CCT motif family protein, putative isoform 1 [Theobroma cacao]
MLQGSRLLNRKLDAMSPGETVSRSPLDKPLNQLTEDDISQVTREDCRRYLKEKGMRRPSWNKSQAIQQVISLKTLLETTSDSDAVEACKKLHIPCPENPPRVVSDSTVLVNETTQHNGNSAPVNESVPCPRPDPSKSDFSGDNSGRNAISGNDSVSPRTAGAAKEQAGQMTIFYCGEVNVYDDMPGCKAQAILQLAASPLSLSQETAADQSRAPWSVPCQLQAAGVKISPCSPMVILPSPQTVKVAENCQFPWEESNISREDSLEGPSSRKALVQRYLERKKDRFKNKRKLATSSSPTLDIYINQVGDQFANEQLKPSEPYSSSQTRPPYTPLRCNSIENVPKIASLATHPDAKASNSWKGSLVVASLIWTIFLRLYHMKSQTSYASLVIKFPVSFNIFQLPVLMTSKNASYLYSQQVSLDVYEI